MTLKSFQLSYGWIIVAAGFLVLFAESIIYLYGVLIKPLILEFGWSRAAASSAYALTMATYVFVLIPMGWLYDGYGPRVLMGIGAILTGLGLALSSVASSIWHLYATLASWSG